MSKHPETKRCEAVSEFFISGTPHQVLVRLLRVVHEEGNDDADHAARPQAALALTGRAAILSFEAWRKALLACGNFTTAGSSR